VWAAGGGDGGRTGEDEGGGNGGRTGEDAGGTEDGGAIPGRRDGASGPAMVDDGDGAPLRGVTPRGVACRLGPCDEGPGDRSASAVRLSMGRFGEWPTTPASMITARPQATVSASAGCDNVRRDTAGLRTRGWGRGIIASAPRLVARPIRELAGMSALDRHGACLAIT
jgi:hypothetical protein